MDNVAWHENCVLRDDVRYGTLALAEFAADLNSVRTGEAPNVYRKPDRFFSRTYPTDNLKTLVRDVLHRLAGRDGKPVIRVQVAYGGGKTHSLISLLHLAEGGAGLEHHTSVQVFMGFSGLSQLPQARVALLPFDKFDVIEGLSVAAPDGSRKQVKTPWGALAYQLAGAEGLARVAAHEADYVRPSENILAELLSAPQADGLSTLVLMDETLMYMRGAVAADQNRLGILQDFFQMLTQAVSRVDGAALVASLISHEMVSDDSLSVRCLDALEHVFRRVEETTEPVSEQDIPELLRRRLFEDVVDVDARRPIVEHLARSMHKLSLREADAYDRLLETYPFHPNLLEVFYRKWTGLGKFQRTRGVLRAFAIALKASEGVDPSAFVGTGVLLGRDGQVSEAMRDLIETCDEGNQWTPILGGELKHARQIQATLPRLTHREIENAVLATFLHSQPAGKTAETTDIYRLLAHADVDTISVEEGLAKWREISWFLKENDTSWSLGTTSNLTKMHVEAMRRLKADDVNDDLVQRIRDARLGQTSDDIKVHPLPDSPNDVPDTPNLHLIIVGPEHAAVPGEDISAPLKVFFRRTYGNHVILLAADSSRLSGLEHQLRKIRAWQDIESGDEMNLLSETQQDLLRHRREDDQNGISDSVKTAYNVLITLDEDGQIKAQQIPPGPQSAFERVKVILEEEERFLTTSLDPELLQPGSYLELWGNDETSKPVQGLYAMFASLPRLPKLLNRRVFLETIRRGVSEGKIVLRDVRGDGSQQTFWRQSPSDEDLSKKGLEIVPIEHAELHNLDPEQLRPDALPKLWRSGELVIRVSAILEYFNGDDVPKLASDEVLFRAVKSAIQAGIVMGRSQGTDYYREEVADSVIDGDWELMPRPAEIRGSEITHHTLPEAWEEDSSTVGKVWTELTRQRGAKPPWVLVEGAVNQGLSTRLFEIAADGLPWPCATQEADGVGLRVSEAPMRLGPREIVAAMQNPPDESGYVTLGWIKETLESIRGAPIPDDVYRDAVAQALNRRMILSEDAPVDEYYQRRVRLPAWVSHAESPLTEVQIQDFAEAIGSLSEIAPELKFEFQLSITTEGERPSDEVLEQLNEVLGRVADSLKFGSDES